MRYASQQAEAPQRLASRGKIVLPGLVSEADGMKQTGRYRVRTWVRGNLPYALTALAPKGKQDCGNHQWYREDAATALCYHCEVGERPLVPGQKVADPLPPWSENPPVAQDRGQQAHV